MTDAAAACRIDRLRRPVAELARSIDFYRGALGFQVESRDAGGARLRLGGQSLELVLRDRTALAPAEAVAPDPRFQHAAVVTNDMESVWRRVEAHGAVSISRGGPQVLPANTGGVTAFKFRDPDGHPLELIRFPAGTGDPRWQTGSPHGPTLGIDHCALVVESVEPSVAFFAQCLGFGVTSRGINRGAEQDRLDGLDGVEVDVVSLAPRAGDGTPHLELLRYRHPVPHAARTAAQFKPAGRDEIVCCGEWAGAGTGTTRRFADPDGHRFRLHAS